MYPSLLRVPGDLFAEFDDLTRQMERLLGPAGAVSSIRAVQRGSFPAVNIGVTPDTVEIYAFAPGIDAKTLEVSVDKGLLTLAGKREAKGREAGAKQTVYASERIHGEFRRVMSLPEDADPDRVDASYRNGIVHIHIQKREASKPRRITVKDTQ